MFFDGSRYLRVPDCTIEAGDGAPRKLKATREPVATETALTYQVREGDRLDLLAYKFYRNPRKWWLIADANPDCIAPEQLLAPGRVLVIPKDKAV
jgi:nucleoid-associated protein YgaU